jgi:hypothetical protein
MVGPRCTVELMVTQSALFENAGSALRLGGTHVAGTSLLKLGLEKPRTQA